jgi:hypothetical protein
MRLRTVLPLFVLMFMPLAAWTQTSTTYTVNPTGCGPYMGYGGVYCVTLSVAEAPGSQFWVNSKSASNWIDWSLLPFPNPLNLCTGLVWSSNAPSGTLDRSVTYSFTYLGGCSGNNGTPYTLSTVLQVQIHYSTGGGGRACGGCGWKENVTSGTFTLLQ